MRISAIIAVTITGAILIIGIGAVLADTLASLLYHGGIAR